MALVLPAGQRGFTDGALHPALRGSGPSFNDHLWPLFPGSLGHLLFPILMLVLPSGVFEVPSLNNKYVHWGLLQNLGRVSQVTGQDGSRSLTKVPIHATLAFASNRELMVQPWPCQLHQLVATVNTAKARNFQLLGRRNVPYFHTQCN
jgi:hypothetical protein